ncbi:MAG: trypsin-like peptidase domain-containing protein [Anaerolineae bacterium]|nr:trypsin-like peptidase domain-containing protein [Anaerolineae bacterium]
MLRRSRLLLVTGMLVLATLACIVPTEKVAGPAAPPTALPAYTPIAWPTPLPGSVVDPLITDEALLIDIYARAIRGVVNIDVAVTMDDLTSPLGSGSGFVIDTAGHIATNEHVVDQADVFWVTFSDGTVREAELLGADPYSDLAVVYVADMPPGVAPLELGNSSTLQVGQRAIAIGNPFGHAGTMTVGIISALGRTLPAQATTSLGNYSIPEIIQTDAAVNPGNSGGPLLDSSGRVIGVNAAIETTGTGNQGIAFAIPIDIVKLVAPYLIAGESYPYPYLGITSDTRYTLAQLSLVLDDLPTTQGVLISAAPSGGPAARAGLRGGTEQVPVLDTTVTLGGDIITAIDGTPVGSFHDLIAYLIRETQVGQRVTLTILRNGEEMDIPIELGSRP